METGENYRFEGHYQHGFRKEGELKWKAADGNYTYTGTFNEHNNFHGKGTFPLTQASWWSLRELTKATS